MKKIIVTMSYNLEKLRLQKSLKYEHFTKGNST
jgi:hypothetical protein